MLLKNHKIYTAEKVLGKLTIEEDIKKQIKIGSYANDLCELTNEVSVIVGYQEKAVPKFSQIIDQLDNLKEKSVEDLTPAIYESHFGGFSSLHAMANDAGEAPEKTKDVVSLWFDSFNMIALGREITPNNKICQDDIPIGKYLLLNKIYNTYNELFDSSDAFEIKYRAVGMMCHLIQDSFTVSHCKRDSLGRIEKFYHYNSQSKNKHRKYDNAFEEHEDKLIRHCKTCIDSLVVQGEKYDYSELLMLSDSVQPADGGTMFAKSGFELIWSWLTSLFK